MLTPLPSPEIVTPMVSHLLHRRDKNEALKKIAPEKHRCVLQRSENSQVTRFTVLISPP